MHLTINGEPREVRDGIGVEELIRELGVHPEMIAVQHNDDIVDRKRLDGVTLRDGDRLELIRIVGGG